jgi:hypothetical protein
MSDFFSPLFQNKKKVGLKYYAAFKIFTIFINFFLNGKGVWEKK